MPDKIDPPKLPRFVPPVAPVACTLTPGYWHMLKLPPQYAGEFFAVGVADNKPVATVIIKDRTIDEAFANARVIARSPELLESLKALIRDFELIANNPDSWESWKKAKAVLGQLKGTNDVTP